MVEVDKNELLESNDLGNLENLDNKDGIDSQIDHPQTLLIWSVKATPVVQDIATGLYYNITDFIIGNDTYFPNNQMIISFSPEQLTAWEKIINDSGYNLIGWMMNITYQPNTLQIPRRLSILDEKGNEYDYVALSSADWNKRRVYQYGFDHFEGGQYYGLVEGRLVATNLDGSAEWFPFAAGMIFN